MKKLSTLILIFFVAFQMTSCKSEKKETKKEEKVSDAAFVLSKARKSVNWTAYKFTEKTGVKGKFKKVNITSGGEGNTVKEAINNAEFSIPVSSIFSSDSGRDFKIKKYFFGIMENTELLSGKLVIETDSTGYANLTMNGRTEKLPFNYTIAGKEFSMSTKMDLLNWNAKPSIDSLNVACKELHKGTDGVSKLWSEVDIDITTVFQ